MKQLKIFLLLLCLFSKIYSTPRLTVVFVIDQFAYHYLDKVKPNLTGGIGQLFNKGIFYKNAYVPHAHPSTGCGHVAISTGTYAQYHGIVGNSWLNKKGEKTRYEAFNINPEYSEFSPTGLYPLAKAPTNIMVDGLSDQFILHSKPNKNYTSFALSHKARSAIGLASKLGKAIWFDKKGRQFTSSKAYFEKPPKWLQKFNNKYLAKAIPKTMIWELAHKRNPFAYNFNDTKNYKFSSHPFSMIGKSFGDLYKNHFSEEYDELYIKSPHANQHLLDLAKECLNNTLSKNENDKFLLWVGFSTLDPLGHYYGPYSQEALDMIYHLDWQIEQFMEFLSSKVNSKDILYVLTADHGVMPIIEILKEKGMKGIYRIRQKKLIKKINEKINEKYKVKDILKRYINPQFYVNKKTFDHLPKDKKTKIRRTIQNILKKVPGIQKVWTFNQLKNLQVEPDSVESWYKKQLYENRSGEFICKVLPYCTITKYPTGTGHRSPYEYDSHIPLVIYQRKKFEKKTVEQKILITQLANTLANILDIPKPSASREDPLPL